MAKTGQPIAVEVTATDPRMTEMDRMLTKIYDRGSYFCAPLKIGEEVIGIIAAWFILRLVGNITGADVLNFQIPK